MFGYPMNRYKTRHGVKKLKKHLHELSGTSRSLTVQLCGLENTSPAVPAKCLSFAIIKFNVRSVCVCVCTRMCVCVCVHTRVSGRGD